MVRNSLSSWRFGAHGDLDKLRTWTKSGARKTFTISPPGKQGKSLGLLKYQNITYLNAHSITEAINGEDHLRLDHQHTQTSTKQNKKKKIYTKMDP